MMNREIGFGRKLLNILEDELVSYEHIPSGIDNISLILSRKNFTKDIQDRVIERIKSELKVDDISIEDNLALIMVVEKYEDSVGIAAK